MAVAAVICEYNPFHNGHLKQFRQIRDRLGADTRIVCLMSGNFVQRGEPAVFDKGVRTRAAVLSGADLVLELPVTAALSSAEGFAAEGVRLLSALHGIDYLAFGCESGDGNSIMSTTKALLAPGFDERLKEKLETGISYAAARQQALGDAFILDKSNDILAVEYGKALLRQSSAIQPLALLRDGDYLAQTPDSENPSALSIRRAMRESGVWEGCVPAPLLPLYKEAAYHDMAYAERAVLARLRSLSDAEFEALPYGAEGLWRKLLHACRSEGSVEAILTAVKSKRYARSRLCRMVMCAYLGITAEALAAPAPYVRVLGFSENGRTLLRQLRSSAELPLPDAGEKPAHGAYYAMECRCSNLYSLFSKEEKDFLCCSEEHLRNFYEQNEKNACK